MKKVLIILLVLFVLIQFFPIDKSNPVPSPQMNFLTIKKTPESTANLIRNGCYDCHSNETKYPWYSNIQPVGWLLKNHITEGRKQLNFSTFATYNPKKQAHVLDEAAEMILNDKMPMDSYKLNHPEAQFSKGQKQEMMEYFKLLAQDIRILNPISNQHE